MSLDNWDIRPRAILGAAVPTMVMAIVLIAYFTSTRLSDLEEAHSQRGKALAKQLAAASAYIVFAGDRDALQRLADAILQEPDVVHVVVTGPRRDPLAEVRKPSPPPSALRIPATSRPRSFSETINGPGIVMDDPFLETGSNRPALPTRQGDVLVEMTRESLQSEEARLLRNAVLMMITVLLASVVLAGRMSRGVSGPILRIASMVARFGAGDRSARVEVEGGKSLRALAQGVNDMADRLTASSEDLERQIANATVELLKKKEEAERSNRAKTRFLAAASHDLRQPMHALGLFIADLAQKPHAPDTSRLVAQIAMSAETMENLLDSLLDISRLDAGVLDRQIKPFPLQPLLERLDVDYRHEAALHEQRLRLRPTSLWVMSDPVLMERILHNLISNALRYSPGGTVLVVCRRRGDKVRIEVRDNGPGIAREAQDAIFQEFFQLDNPERNRAKGLGLGLAIVRRLTDLLEHPLNLNSTPGEGSVFAVTLPVAPAGILPQGEPPPAPHSLAGLHVVLIDDDALAVASTSALLESWGCLVTAAETLDLARAALDRIGEEPDILLCDHHVDGSVDGIANIERLRREMHRDIPAIILSSDTSTATANQVQQAGIRLLHKPVRPARLRALLQRKTNG